MTTVALAGQLVTTSGILDDGVLEVRLDGTIGYVGPASGWSGPDPEPVDTVAPGYVDIHCHGGGSHTVTSGEPSEVAAVAAHHLSRGTTTMLASLVSAPAPELVAAIAAIAAVAAKGSPVVGCHVEGPFLDPEHRGAHDRAHLRLPGSDELAAWLAAGVDDTGRPTVRMVTLAPELPGAVAAAELLEDSGVVVGLGHTGADAGGFGEALRSLRRPLVTHLFNGMEPLHHRRPGPVAAALDALAHGATHVELIADGVHLADETVHLVFAMDPGRHVVLVSDAMQAAGMPDGDFELGSVRVRVAEGRAWTRTEPPMLAGGTAHVADLVRRCVVHAGIDPVAAVAAATSTPAALLGLDDRGSLATGLRADLVVLDRDWQVRQVMRGGGLDPMTCEPGEALVAVSPVDAPSVLLTYDDGPDPEGTPAVLRELAAADARATFFVLGTRVQLYPDVFRSVVADGHEIGLHGADHRRVDRIPGEEFSRGLIESKDLLEQAIQRPVVWYRPPYGRLTLAAWEAVHDAGLSTAGWTCDIQDWLDVPLEQHLAGLDAVTRAGEIVLSHDAYADGRDLVDDGPPPSVDRALLARAVLDRVASVDCAHPTVTEAVEHGTPVWRPWVGAVT